MHCSFTLLKGRQGNFRRPYTQWMKTPLQEGGGSSNNFSYPNPIFLHTFEQKLLVSKFCFSFSFNYCYYWSGLVGTVNINFVLTLQGKALHSIIPPLSWRMHLSVSNFEKWGSGNLKSSNHIYLHGKLTMLLVKKDFVI